MSILRKRRTDHLSEGDLYCSLPIERRRRIMASSIAGIKIPDSQLAAHTTEFIRDTESPLLYHHSRRAFLFGMLHGELRGLKADPELLYVGAMFHDLGLVEGHRN